MNTQEKLDRFCRNMKALRLQKRLSQVELGDMAKISNMTICRIEVGRHKPSLESALMISEALNVSIGDLCEKEFECARAYAVGKRRRFL